MRKFNGSTKIRQGLRQLWRNQRGGTAIEYGLILVVVCLACLSGMKAVGSGVQNMYNDIRINFVGS